MLSNVDIDVYRAKISAQTPQNQPTGSHITGLDHVFLNAPHHRPSQSVADPSTNINTAAAAAANRSIQRAPIQHDSFQDAITRLRNAPANPQSPSANISYHNGHSSLTRVTFPVLPPPPDTRPAARPAFRPPPHPATYRRTSLPAHFGPMPHPQSPNIQGPHPLSASHLSVPLPHTPEMNSFGSLEEFQELLGKQPESPPPCLTRSPLIDSSLSITALASPQKGGELDLLPDYGVFGPNAADGMHPDIDHTQRLPAYSTLVASLLLNQPDLTMTPQFHQTPSLVEASPDLDLIAPINASRKGPHGTPSTMAGSLPLASPRTGPMSLFELPGNFGFFEQDPSATSALPFGTVGYDNLLHIVGTLNPPLPPTISPSDTYLSTLTPGLYTPTQLLDTPSVGTTSPLLETPAHLNMPLVGSSSAHAAGKKHASPLSLTKGVGTATPKAKRDRSEDQDDVQASKKRKHTGTRPGISSDHMLAPGDPPQSKTYLTESSTSRKDIPASYKVKAGESPDDITLKKIDAKRTANRDSARRSRQRKQQAMELAQNEINWLAERVNQLEEFVRSHGLEPPVAPFRSPPRLEEDEELP
ncbi:hypothetical protein FRB91_000241 [Serendipita sp. 411]|nr:hypothetical protein FRB91_000241 [Serendipita sp. 411]